MRRSIASHLPGTFLVSTRVCIGFLDTVEQNDLASDGIANRFTDGSILATEAT